MRNIIMPGLMAIALSGASTIAIAQTTAPAASETAPVETNKMDRGDGAKSEMKGTATSSESVTTRTVPLTITAADAEKWVGKRVYSSDGSDIGEISAYHAASDGKVQYFHTDIGGFLGIGETSVQVTPAQFDMRDEKLYLSMTKDEALKLPRVTN